MTARAAIVSLGGLELTPGEAELLAARPPAGMILFARNCGSKEQLANLIRAVRLAAADPDLPILVDQEGGRVARLRPPEWRRLPAMGAIGRLAHDDPAIARRAAALAGALIAADLVEIGITVACAPVLDVLREGATPAIGDRSFGGAPDLVADLGLALAEALIGGGVTPVMKHLPGHGAARVDSHAALPVVDATLAELRAIDLVPFRRCRHLPLAMTAHVVYSAVDAEHPATLSRVVIADLIRGDIGFSGVLISDDLGMGALSGPLPERALAALEAGCDLALYCGGRTDETREVLEAVPPVTEDVAARLQTTRRTPVASAAFDTAAASAELDAVLQAV